MIFKDTFKFLCSQYNSYRIRLKHIKRIRLKVFLALINTIILLMLTIGLQYVSLTRSDESSFLEFASIFKHNILGIDPKPDERNVIFLDVSKDIITIDDPDFSYSDTDSLLGAKVTIKDRKKLTTFFKALNANSNKYKYVICDILFDYTSPDDSILKPIVEKTKHLTTTSIFEDKQFIQPIFNVSSGCVNYSLINDSKFTKIPLLYSDTIKSLPVVVYEDFTGNKVHKKRFLTYFGDDLAFNTVIPEMYYRATDLRRINDDDKKANFFYLGEIITKKNFFEDYLKGKFIIIGDFTNDNHATYAGTIPGCMILFNTYLTLIKKAPVFSFVWLFILFIIYFSISYFMIVHPEEKLNHLKGKIQMPFFKKMILKYISFIGILIVVDLVSYLFYSTFISIFYIATYLTFLEMIIDNYLEIIKKLKYFIMKIRPSFLMFLIVFLLINSTSYSQTVYSVSAQKGKIYYNNKLIKVGDELTHLDKLTAETRDSKIRLLNPQKGSYLITFLNGVPIVNENIKKKSELYQIVVQKYIDNFNSSKILSTRGDFDWYAFFTVNKGEMALFEGQKISLTGNIYKIKPNSLFFATVYKEKDSIVVALKRVSDTLFFDQKLFPKGLFTWKLKMSYTSNTKNKFTNITKGPLMSSFVSIAELKDIVELFSTNWKQSYINEEFLIKDIYNYLEFNYGVVCKSYINPLIRSYIKH
jgi:hypothetical protein